MFWRWLLRTRQATVAECYWKMYMTREPTECLLNNVIDRDIQAALYPFIIIRKLFLLSNFTIIRNFITPNNAVSYIKSVIGALFLMFICCNRFFKEGQLLNSAGNPLLSCIICYVDFIVSFFFWLGFYIVNVMQRSNFVLLIVKLQYILNTINMDKERIIFKFRLSNWIYIISIISFFIFFITIGALLTEIDSVHYPLVAFPCLLVDLQIIFLSSFVQILSDVLNSWHKKMIYYKKIHYNLTQNATNDEELSGNKMFHTYKNILESFRLIEEIFCFVVSILSF